MRFIFSIILVLFVRLLSFGQSTVDFNIEIILIDDSSDIMSAIDFGQIDSVFFQDEQYFVRRTCVGEFGGSIWFKNKKSGIEYSCSATCPVSVNKFDKKYLVTTTLTHFQRYSSLLEIENPDSMEIFQEPDLERAVGKLGLKKRRLIKWRFRKMYYSHSAGELESKSRKGTRSILDTLGINILLSFPYQNNLYHIIRDSNTLYLSRLEGSVITTVDTIFSGLDKFNIVEDGIKNMYNTDVFKTGENSYKILFENSGLLGYLDINENKIRLTLNK